MIRFVARSFGQEPVLPDDAFGRVLAESILADRDYPPFNRAAMDGYAIKIADWQKGTRIFEIKETIYAGAQHSADLAPGECYKIMTGAAVPICADTVIRKEDAKESNKRVELKTATIRSYQNIAKKGEDIRFGQPVLSAQRLCDPVVISLLASLGKQHLLVEKLPQVALITTGSEIVAIDAEVSPVEIRNSNQYLIKSLLKKWGISPAVCRHAPDDQLMLAREIEQGLSCDILILCGGVSAGDTDHVRAVLDRLGVIKLFHQVAVKPGKPIWCGQMPRGGMVFALPGNPFSCLVTYKLFIESYFSSCFGLSDPIPLKIPLKSSRSKNNSIDEFFPVCISGQTLMLNEIKMNGSGDIRLGSGADGLGLHSAGKKNIEAGEEIDYYKLF